jgi:hypothetical protein
VRLHPDDIAQLFARVPSGTSGRVVYEPVLLADVGMDVFLEVHPDVYNQRRGDARETVRRLAADLGLTDRIEWAAADAVIAARHGIARRVTHLPLLSRHDTE